MSDWTIWGHKAHLIMEVEGRMIEVIDPIKPPEQPGRPPELNFTRIREATEEARLTRPVPPKFKDVTFDA